jgi:hypothetical protein
VAKAKRKNKTEARQINFNNPKTMNTIRYLQLSENRLSRQDLLTIGNKDILYQLKNGGYIKESAGGIFQGTSKLHTHMKKLDGSSFSKSNSPEHSAKILNSAKLLPKQVISEGRFQTGTDLQQQYQKMKHHKEYQEALKQEREALQGRINGLSSLHREFQRSEENRAEKLQEAFNYRSAKEALERSMTLLKENQFSPPDYAVELTKSEGEDYLDSLSRYRDSLEEHSRDYSLYTEAVEKLSCIISQSEGSFTVGIEIITNSYGSLDMEKHSLYEQLTHQTVLYLT